MEPGGLSTAWGHRGHRATHPCPGPRPYLRGTGGRSIPGRAHPSSQRCRRRGAAGEARGRPRSGSRLPAEPAGLAERPRRVAPLRSSPGPAPRGRPRRCPGSGGGRRRGGEGDEASRNCFASRPLCLRQRRVSVAWCRSSAYGHPGTFLCKPFCPRHPRFLAGFLQLL